MTGGKLKKPRRKRAARVVKKRKVVRRKAAGGSKCGRGGVLIGGRKKKATGRRRAAGYESDMVEEFDYGPAAVGYYANDMQRGSGMRRKKQVRRGNGIQYNHGMPQHMVNPYLLPMYGQGYGTTSGAKKGWESRSKAKGSKLSKGKKQKRSPAQKMWIDFVKGYANDNGLNYAQALRDPGLSELYQEAKASM